MPVHDWTRVEPGSFHAFHSAWVGEIQKALNGGLRPSGFYALAEQHAGLLERGSGRALGSLTSSSSFISFARSRLRGVVRPFLPVAMPGAHPRTNGRS
jgi:hypothetical protein